MNNLAAFSFEGQQIRFINGKPVANDVATVLGYADPAKTISTKVDVEYKGVTALVTPGGKQSVTVLEEPGIYQLIFSSKLPSAKAFQKWVFEEVLPSIRKTGGYGAVPRLNPYWCDRLIIYYQQNKVPAGWWSIFEQTIKLVADLELYGYALPEDRILDISIGKCWCNYLRKELRINPKDVAQTYPHQYPGWVHPVDAYIYPISLIVPFHEWLNKMYKPISLPTYFKKTDPSALPMVQEMIKSLPDK